jgi:two-component system response regulator VicR
MKPIIDGRDLTTGQIAKVCQVSSRTVTAWIDNGKLLGYRLPSGGKKGSGADRRVQRRHLETFMAENGMPVERLKWICWRVLIASPTSYLCDEVTRELANDSSIFVDCARDLLETGHSLAVLNPNVVVIDCAFSEVHRILRAAKDAKKVVLMNEDDERSTSEIEIDLGVYRAFKKPVDVEALTNLLSSFRRGCKEV